MRQLSGKRRRQSHVAAAAVGSGFWDDLGSVSADDYEKSVANGDYDVDLSKFVDLDGYVHFSGFVSSDGLVEFGGFGGVVASEIRMDSEGSWALAASTYKRAA